MSLDDTALDLLFNDARTQNEFADEPLDDAALKAVYDLAKMAPTSANCQPARYVFVRSAAAKERLRPHLVQGNVAKTMKAPVCVIVAYDTKFYELQAENFPHNPGSRDWFAGEEAQGYPAAIRNGTLSGGYFILAARALGLDCGPLSGFDQAGVDKEFFPDGRYKSNFLINLGRGTGAGVFPRSPRLAFDRVCEVL